MPNKVKCSQCGFLAVRDEYDDTLLKEAVERVRDRGLDQSSKGNATVAKVLCYRKSSSFCKPVDGTGEEGVKAAIQQEIDCDLFADVHPGKTPKELEEMTWVIEAERRAKDAEQREAAFRIEMEVTRKTEREEDKSIRKKEREEDIRANERRYQWNLLVSGVAVVASVIATLIAAKLLPWW